MSRIANAWRALMGAESEVCASCDSEGVLFGLNPPSGCHFEVSCHKGESWHVRIYRGRSVVAHACSLIGERWGDGSTDEEWIVSAANRAVLEFERVESRKHLEGCYPPKRAKGAK